MGLPKAWVDLDRDAVAAAPESYGVYEFAGDDGTRGVETGPIRDAVKEELSYGDATRVRWRAARSRAHAERLAEEYG